MDLDQPQPGKVPDLTGLSGKVAPGLTGRRSWLGRFLGICLLAAVVGSPARWAGGVDRETSPSAKVQNTWLTTHVSAVPTTPAAPTITFDQPPDVTVGTPVPLTATATPRGLPVLFRADTPSVCTVAVGGSTVTTVAAGPCTITAFQDGSARRPAAPDVMRSFQVEPPTTRTITFDQPPDVTVGTPVPLTATASAPGLPVLFRPDTPSVCTVAGSTVTTVAAGTCTITAFQDGNPPLAAPDVTRSFQVNRVRAGLAPQTITFGQPPDARAGTPVVLSARASSGLAVLFSSDTASVCTVADSTVTTVAAGTCTITASQSGSARYAAAPDVTRSFQVNPFRAGLAPQTITFGQPPDARAGTPVVLSARASSGLAVLFSSDTASVCTVADSTVTIVAAGTCTITASQSGSARYAAAPDVTRSFQENRVTSKVAGALVSLLAAAAVILTAAAAAATLAVRRRRLRPHPLPTPGPSVRAVPYTGPPGLVSVHTTGAEPTHTVRIETSPGTSVTTIEEARP
jgi:hypothetical protein